MINTVKTVTVSFHAGQSQRFLKPQIALSDMDIKCKYETNLLVLHVTEDIK